jgi:hypothetical protein
MTSQKSTGIFLPASDDYYEEYLTDVASKSIVGVAESLGYHVAQVQSIYLFDHPFGIHSIAFLPLTRTPLFVMTEETTLQLSADQIDRIIQNIDWGLEADPSAIEFILEDAVEAKSWDISFMQRIFPELPDKQEQVYESKQYGLYLIIMDGFLAAYNPADGLSTWGKSLDELNPGLFQAYVQHGKQLHGDEKAILYANLQAQALASLTGGAGNPYVKEYTLSNGTIDFFMILVEKEKQPVSIEAFELRMGNTARLIENDKGTATYQVSGKNYRFRDGKFHSIEQLTAGII